MKISDGTRFPHPVLSGFTNDFGSGQFDVQFQIQEKPLTGALTFQHRILLTEPGIADLVVKGVATVGCFVRCNDTYHTELRELGWPTGMCDFLPGSLINRVTLRPLVWLRESVADWNPGTIHPEFEPPFAFDRGSIIAIGPEYVISVGQAKFAPMESIFELSAAPDVPEGQIRINPESDRVVILVGPELFGTINLLRGQASGRTLLMNAVYLPAVIELLDLLRVDAAQYSGRRWYQPFTAKCDARGIDPEAKLSLFESAQKLLGWPARELSVLANRDDE